MENAFGKCEWNGTRVAIYSYTVLLSTRWTELHNTISIESVSIYAFRTYSSTNWLFYSNRNGIRKHIRSIEITLAFATFSNSMASLSFHGMQSICRWNWVVNIVTFRWNSVFFSLSLQFSLLFCTIHRYYGSRRFTICTRKDEELPIAYFIACIKYLFHLEMRFVFVFLSFSSSCIVPIELFLNVTCLIPRTSARIDQLCNRSVLLVKW